MNPSMTEIEANLFTNLKALGCPPLKNLSNIDPNITLSEIFVNPIYLEEKLNTIMWIIFNLEPRFAPEFVEFEFHTVEIRCKKILEALSLLGLIESVDAWSEKLFNTNPKTCRDILLVINDLNNILQKKCGAQSVNYDDIIGLELEVKPGFEQEDFAEKFAQKMQVLDDCNFLREFNAFQQITSQSLIPTELKIFIKNLYENGHDGEYPDRTNTKEALIEYLNSQLEKMNERFEKTLVNETSVLNGQRDYETPQQQQNFSDIEQNLNETSTFLKEFNQFVNGLKSMKGEDHEEENSAFGKFLSATKNPLVDSNIGVNFFQYSMLNEQFKKLSGKLIGWVDYMSMETKNLIEYEGEYMDWHRLESVIADVELFKQELDERLDNLGYNRFDDKDFDIII